MRKLKVEWNECDDISILSARSLELDDLCTSVEAVEESTDSESSLSIDEEAGDSMDYSEGRQGDLEEPGVSQLRPHGTEWLVETEGIQIDYYDGAKRNLDFIWTFDNPVEQRSPLEYFCAMFPMVEAAFWIEKTNARLAEMKRKPLSKCEYFRFWGLILASALVLRKTVVTIGWKNWTAKVEEFFSLQPLVRDLEWGFASLRTFFGVCPLEMRTAMIPGLPFDRSWML